MNCKFVYRKKTQKQQQQKQPKWPLDYNAFNNKYRLVFLFSFSHYGLKWAVSDCFKLAFSHGTRTESFEMLVYLCMEA